MTSAEQTTRALGGHWHGSYGTAKCPCHDDHKESLSITDGEVTTLYKCFVGCSSVDIARKIAALNGHAPAKPNGHGRELAHPEFGKPLYRHDYLDVDGTLRFVVCRWEWPDRPKELRPAVPSGEGWRWTLPKGPRPPYRLRQAIAETSCGILIVEGEKKADIASNLLFGWVVVGWSGGASAWEKTDWSLIPSDRRVVIWPDNDPPGIKAANAIAARIPGAAVVDVASLGLPEKWDLGEIIPPNLDPEAIVDATQPVHEAKVAVEEPLQDDPPPWEPPGETTSDPGPRFALIPFDNLVAPLAPYYLVKGILPARGLAVVWGPPKCGKSFWTFDLVMHVALGWSYRGRKTRQGPVVYVACEGGDYFGARVEAFRQTRMADDPATTPFFLVKGSLDLIKDHKRLAIEIAQQCPNPAVVVIDTVNTSLNGSEIDDMPAYTKAAIFVAQTLEAAVIVVHHCGVAGERPRGHSSLTGNCDAQIAVKKTDLGLITATVDAMKDGEDGSEIKSRLAVVEVGTDTDGDPITSCVIDPADTEPGPARNPADKLGKNLELGLLILQDAGPNGLDQEDWNSKMEDAGLKTKQRQSEVRLKLKAKKRAHEYAGRWYANSKPQKSDISNSETTF